ncbi:hypothetical protein WICPIJ_008193 [Wickerhamomyces pijperi]|uniref:Rhodanese domain-containing protein n=1 Tax=Wickerhamomyces pijperi TaxID=599730 RepID=A0A9P8PZV6_WICPI|nr:hypothetical protein WICPIJ_008193 [Wickerhamomyces pijperi]
MSKRSIQLLSPLSYRGLLSARSTSRVIPIDGSWYMPNNPRNPKLEFQTERLPNSKFFDLDGVKDDQSSYPHMLPSLEQFNTAMSQLGLRKDDKLIIYDRVGNFSAPRVAWTFQTFGHDNVYLLNNFPSYQTFAYPMETKEYQHPEPTEYKSTEFDSDAVLSFEQFIDIVSDSAKRQEYNILDARSYGRFTGEDPEPRAGLSSGHAPGAKSLPFSKVLGLNNLFLDKPSLQTLIHDQLKLDQDKRTIVMCGTGVTACILKTALDSVGFNKAGIQVYDGSWTEYAQRAGEDLIVKGKE